MFLNSITFSYRIQSPVKTIREDTNKQFGVKFPIFDKLDVNGASEHPLYKNLKMYDGEIIGSPDTRKVSWNFEKFLLDSNGVPVRRYKPGIKPGMLDNDINSLIEKGKLNPPKKVSLNEY